MVAGSNFPLASNTEASKPNVPIGMTQLAARLKAASYSSPVIVIESGLSLIDQGYSPIYTAGGGVVKQYTQKGVLNWLRRLTLQGFETPFSAGISGSTVQEIQERVFQDVIAKPGYPTPHAVYIQTGGNDINSVTSYDMATEVLAEMKWRMEAYIQTLLAYGIWPIVATMPNNGLWQSNNYASWIQDQWQQYLLELEGTYPVSVLNFDPLMCYSDYQPETTGITGTASGTGRTITHTAHGYSTGDRVIIRTEPRDIVYDTMPGGAQITVVDANTYTYTTVGASAAPTGGGVYAARRMNIRQELTSDGTTHYNTRVASKAARSVLDWFKAKFPPRDILSARETDFTNFVGGNTAATQLHSNIGMMAGTGGSKTGTPLPTGDVADGWTVDVAGGAPTSVTCSRVPYAEPGLYNFTWQKIEVVAAAAEVRVNLKVAMTVPSDWAAATAQSAGTWRRPTPTDISIHRNYQNDMWYVAIQAGTTGAVEPIWPRRAGETVVDGTVIWECRQGYIPGFTRLQLAADCWLQSMTSEGLVCLTCEIRDMVTPNQTVRDFFDASELAGQNPLYLSGDRMRLATPKAVTDSAANSIEIIFRMRIAAGATVALNFSRVTLRKIPERTYNVM